MIGRRLVNGAEGGGIAADDRGLQYGDGLFETMAAVDGRLPYLDLHLGRLQEGCERLGIPMPARDHIEDDCCRVLQGLGSAVVKLIVTRGPGPRGYPPPLEPTVTRIVTAASGYAREIEPRPLMVAVCRMRLGINEQLAGIKTLNRLEQVLAAAELRGHGADEGLMLATDGRLIAATAANVFAVRSGHLYTPVIRDCGISGVMRHVVLAAADAAGIPTHIVDMELDELAVADEVFLTNAVRGIRPVHTVAGVGQYEVGQVTHRLRAQLEVPAA